MAPATATEKAIPSNSLGPISFGSGLRREVKVESEIDLKDTISALESRTAEAALDATLRGVLQSKFADFNPDEAASKAMLRASKEGVTEFFNTLKEKIKDGSGFAGKEVKASTGDALLVKISPEAAKDYIRNELAKSVFSHLECDGDTSTTIAQIAKHESKEPKAVIDDIASRVTAGLIEAVPLPFTTSREKFSPGRNISIVLDQDTEGNDRVHYINARTGIQSTFAPDATSPDTPKFSELIKRLRGEPITGSSVLEPDEKVPTLKGVLDQRSLWKVYQLLDQYSGGSVVIHDFETRSTDNLLARVRPKIKAIPEMSVKSFGLIKRDSLKDKVFDKARWQRANAIDEAKIECARVKKEPSAAIQELKLLQGLDGYSVEITTRAMGSAPLRIRFSIDMEAEPKPNLKRLAREFLKDDKTSLDESTTMKTLLKIGSIKEISSESDSPFSKEKWYARPRADIAEVTWLGKYLAPGAVIRDVNFKHSTLDFSGSHARFENCTFDRCMVSFSLEDAQLSNCTFEKNTALTGRISGKMDTECRVHGNALGLDFSQVTIGDEISYERLPKKDRERALRMEQNELRRIFHKAILNRSGIPKQLAQVANVPLSEGLINHKMQELDAWFSGSFSHIDILNTLPANFKRQERGKPDTKEKAFDFYPPGFDPPLTITAATPTRDTHILRVFNYTDEYVHASKESRRPAQQFAFVFGPEDEVLKLKDYESARKRAKEEGARLKLGGGNTRTFQALLDFSHLDFEALRKMSETACTVGSEEEESPAPA